MKSYYKTIVFTNILLKGHYRFSDSLQVYPCDYARAPKSEHTVRFPCVMEYSMQVANNYTENWKYWKERQIDRSNALRRLISAITNHQFIGQDEILQSGVWGIPANADPNSDSSERSIWVEEGYIWPEIMEDMFEAGQSKLHEPSHAPALEVADTSTYHYYSEGGPQGHRDEVVFPNCASSVMKAYENLSLDNQTRIDAITQLIDNGLTLFGRMKSLSFLSFVSAIEALVALEYPEPPELCGECKQPRYRVMSKFSKFLRTYVDNSKNSKKDYEDIYDRRSKIAHAGALLLGDAHEHWDKKEEVEEQFRLHIRAMIYARVSIVNWLLTKQNSN